MSCDALQKEFVGIVNGPAVQAFSARAAGAAAQQKGPGTGKPAAPQSAAEMMSVLGGGWAGLMTAQTQAQNLQAVKRQMNDLIPVMPQMMRAQRLLELTMMRSCAWMQAPLPVPQRPPAK